MRLDDFYRGLSPAGSTGFLIFDRGDDTFVTVIQMRRIVEDRGFHERHRKGSFHVTRHVIIGGKWYFFFIGKMINRDLESQASILVFLDEFISVLVENFFFQCVFGF